MLGKCRLWGRLWGVALLLWSVTFMASAADFTLGQLLNELAHIRSARATFTEKQYLGVLDKALESSGELVFEAPAHLEKDTRYPQAESLVLEAGMLTIERNGRRQVLALKDYPEIAAFIDSIRATLAGDQQALETAYQVALSGRYSHWTLQLTPRSDKMRAKVSQVRIRGARTALQQIEIFQADGDRSLMTIDKVTP